jgi:tetratricopeptide (TPR) repeat protein
LKLAFEAIREDGGFPDLLHEIRERLRVVDPSFRTTEDYNNYSAEYAKEYNEDINAFLSKAKESDSKLRQGTVIGGDKKSANSRDILSESIFGDKKKAAAKTEEKFVPSQSALDYAAEVEQRRLAEDQRYKGNECMRSKDFDEAVACYTKSLEMFPDEAATYSNRAMAYLKMKKY